MRDELMTQADHKLWLAMALTYGWMKDKVGMKTMNLKMWGRESRL